MAGYPKHEKPKRPPAKKFSSSDAADALEKRMNKGCCPGR